MKKHLITVVFWLVFSNAVKAGASEDLDRCIFESDTLSPANLETVCTSAIESGELVSNDLAIALTRRGHAYRYLKRYDLALQDFNRAIKLLPNHSIPHWSRGEFYFFELNDYDSALRDFDRAIELDPKNPALFLARGRIHVKKKNFDGAIHDYSNAIRLKPDDAYGYYHRGIAHDYKKQRREALQDLDEAIRLNPKLDRAYFSRGIVYFHLGEYDRAIESYSEAIRLDPQHVSAYLNRGDVYWAKKEFTKAISNFDEVIRRDPKHATAIYSRGYAYYRLNKLDEALRNYDEAIRLRPKDTNFLTGRGVVRLAKQDFAGAIHDFDASIRIKPTYGAYLFRGLVHFNQGRFEAAEADVSQAARLVPNDSSAVLWRYVTTSRAGRNGLTALNAAVPRLDLKDWPGPIVSLYLGKMTADQLLAAARHGNSATQLQQGCEARFHIGEQHLLQGRKTKAAEVLRAVVADCPANLEEVGAALAEVKRLEK